MSKSDKIEDSKIYQQDTKKQQTNRFLRINIYFLRRWIKNIKSDSKEKQLQYSKIF